MVEKVTYIEGVDENTIVPAKTQENNNFENPVLNQNNSAEEKDYDKDLREHNPLYKLAVAENKAYVEALNGYSDPATDAIGFLFIGGTLLLGDIIKESLEASAKQNRLEEAKKLEEAKNHKNPFSHICSMAKQMSNAISAELQLIKDKLANAYVATFGMYKKPVPVMTVKADMSNENESKPSFSNISG